MPELKMWIPLLLCVSVAAETAHAQRSPAGSTLPTQPMLNRFGLERAWWSQATINRHRDRVRHLTADEEVVYVQSRSGLVTAFDSETGRRLWSLQLGRVDQASFPVASNDEYALVVSGMTLFAVQKFSGRLAWQVRLPTHPSTGPTADDRQIYIGSLDGSVYAFDLQRIDRLYREGMLPQWFDETLKWRYKTPDAVTTPPVSTGRLVSFTSAAGLLYTVAADEGHLIFKSELVDTGTSAPLAYANGLLFLASENPYLYCINILNGRVRWEFVSGFRIRTQPRVIADDVFLTPDRGGMFCLSAATGEEKWWRPGITDFLALGASFVYAGDERGNVVILGREDGGPRGSLPLRDFNVRVANDRTDRLYLATEGGMVVCLRERGRDYPTYHLFPERRPILPEVAPEDLDEPEDLDDAEEDVPDEPAEDDEF